MSIVCSICGGTDVKCAAVIDPNTKQFFEFGHDTFQDGQCGQCGNVVLTDPDEVKADLNKLWTEYMAQHRTAPNYALCNIVRHGDYDGYESAYIRIGGPTEAAEKHRIVAVCRAFEELERLAASDPKRNFTVVGCQRFEFHEMPKTANASPKPDNTTIQTIIP